MRQCPLCLYHVLCYSLVHVSMLVHLVALLMCVLCYQVCSS
jgi:hypothetical protein